jgi:hypothetical protein
MTLSPLEAEVVDLRRRLTALEDRVRIDAHAQAFLRGESRVREGDYCVIDGFPTRVTSISSEGKWTYFNGQNVIEPFRVPPSDDIERLHTRAEVAEIVAKVRQEGPWGLSRDDVDVLVDGLDYAIYGHEGRRASADREDRWKALRDRLASLSMQPRKDPP